MIGERNLAAAVERGEPEIGRLGADPLRPFVQEGLFSPHAHPYDISDFERWQMVDMNGVESGLVVENLMLATQAHAPQSAADLAPETLP